MKKYLALFVVLVMTLAAVSAFAAPANISEIQDLPEFPAVPSMTVKSAAGVTTVTMDAPMSWISAVRSWSNYTSLEFDANGVATYETTGQNIAPGFANWGWADSHWGYDYEYGWDPSWGEYVPYSYSDSNGFGDYGYHYTESSQLIENEDGTQTVKVVVKQTEGGMYPMAYAYHGATTDNIDVKYDTHGNLVSATVELTGKNFLGSEEAPVKSKVTFSNGLTTVTRTDKEEEFTYQYDRPVQYISNITEEFADGSTLSADFAQNGKVTNLIRKDADGKVTWSLK